VGCCHLNRYANHTERKQKQFTKQEEHNAKHRQGNTVGITHVEPRRSGIRLLFATYAAKEENKMTHLKLTITYLPSKAVKPRCYPPIAAVISEGVINPCP
jgi:hypothetical protein